MIRQLKAKVRLVGHVFLEYPVHRRRCEKDHIRAEVVIPCSAEFTMTAGLARLQRNPVADFQVLHILPHFHHGSARLMAKHKGRLYHIVTDGPYLVIMQVAAADSYILQLDKHLIVFCFRDIPFLKSHLADPQHYRYFHFSFHDCFLHLFLFFY